MEGNSILESILLFLVQVALAVAAVLFIVMMAIVLFVTIQTFVEVFLTGSASGDDMILIGTPNADKGTDAAGGNAVSKVTGNAEETAHGDATKRKVADAPVTGSPYVRNGILRDSDGAGVPADGLRRDPAHPRQPYEGEGGRRPYPRGGTDADERRTRNRR